MHSTIAKCAVRDKGEFVKNEQGKLNRKSKRFHFQFKQKRVLEWIL